MPGGGRTQARRSRIQVPGLVPVRDELAGTTSFLRRAVTAGG